MNDKPDNTYESAEASGSNPSDGGKSKWLLLMGVLAVGVLVWVSSSNAPGQTEAPSFKWASSYSAGMEQAAAEQQPVFLAFKASWCPPCHYLENEVFTRPEMKGLLKDWVPIHVDVDENRRVAASYDVGILPTLLFLTPDGEVIERHEGALSLEQIAQVINGVEAHLEAAKSQDAATAPSS